MSFQLTRAGAFRMTSFSSSSLSHASGVGISAVPCHGIEKAAKQHSIPCDLGGSGCNRKEHHIPGKGPLQKPFFRERRLLLLTTRHMLRSEASAPRVPILNPQAPARLIPLRSLLLATRWHILAESGQLEVLHCNKPRTSTGMSALCSTEMVL